MARATWQERTQLKRQRQLWKSENGGGGQEGGKELADVVLLNGDDVSLYFCFNHIDMLPTALVREADINAEAHVW